MFRRDLVSSGCEETIALGLSTFVLSLLKGSSTLWTRADQDDELTIPLGLGEDMPILQYDDRLLPYWNRLVEALSSVAFSGHAHIKFSFVHVQLSKDGHAPSIIEKATVNQDILVQQRPRK